MNLNYITLPASMVEELYKDSLIIADDTDIKTQGSEKPTPEIKEEKKEFKWLGENKKNILIIVDDKTSVHIPDEHLSFLTGILFACKLSLADVAIVNINNYPLVKYQELTTFFKTKIVFLFDVEPAAFGLPMSFPHFQIQAFAGNSFLFSPSLKDVEKDKVLKSKLWVTLKRLFNL